AVRLGLSIPEAAGRYRGDDRGQRPEDRHLSQQRSRRTACQRDRFGGPRHAPADRDRRLLPERALAAPQPGYGDEGPALPPLRSRAPQTGREEAGRGGREEGDRFRQPDPILRTPALPSGDG